MNRKKALLSVSTGSGLEAYLKNGLHGDMLGILKPIHRGILEFVGFEILQPQLSYAVVHGTEADRQSQLELWHNRLTYIFEEESLQVGGY